MRRLLLLLPLLLLLGAGIAAALAWRGIHAPGPLAEPATVVIPRGGTEAIAGALAEKGALAKARERLASVQKACGKTSCAPAQALSAAIAKGPLTRVQTAEAVVPEAKAPQIN